MTKRERVTEVAYNIGRLMIKLQHVCEGKRKLYGYDLFDLSFDLSDIYTELESLGLAPSFHEIKADMAYEVLFGDDDDD